MHKKKFLALFLISAIFLSGCPEANPDYGTTGQYDDPNQTYYNSGIDNQTAENCGELNQGCCEWFGTDEFGVATARVYCNDGLECRADICVEGPDYESASRPYS